MRLCVLIQSLASQIHVQEEEELIREWKPEPLVPTLPAHLQVTPRRLVVENTTDAHIQADGGQDFVNFASYNFANLANSVEIKVNKIESQSSIRCSGLGSWSLAHFPFFFCCICCDVIDQEACEDTIRKYGVGSCGPRGFYGTIG